MARRPFVCGNWKMNTLPREALTLATEVVRLTAQIRDVDVAVGPPFVHLAPVAKKLDETRVGLAAQNAHFAPEGAYTGEVSVPMLREVGCTHVILGHSERRQYFLEDDALVAKKLAAVLEGGLEAIVCIGETLEEREGGNAMAVVERQVRGSLAGTAAEQMRKVTLAYEPVWAIGTGRTASPQQAQDVHAHIRGVLADLFGPEVADVVRLQYGGSVKPGNAAELMAQADIDGALVGGAALDAESFAAIVKAASPSRGAE